MDEICLWRPQIIFTYLILNYPYLRYENHMGHSYQYFCFLFLVFLFVLYIWQFQTYIQCIDIIFISIAFSYPFCFLLNSFHSPIRRYTIEENDTFPKTVPPEEVAPESISSIHDGVLKGIVCIATVYLWLHIWMASSQSMPPFLWFLYSFCPIFCDISWVLCEVR